MTENATTYCRECDEVQPYRVEGGTGLWFCRECGFAIDCTECGFTMFRGHNCADVIAAMS